MEQRLITHVDEIDTGWLTETLRRAGALEHGSVVAFDVIQGGGNWSANARLALRYSGDATGDRPVALFLKLVDTDTGDGEFFLPLEVDTYVRSYVDVADAPLLRCYDGVYDPQRRRYHLLLADVTATHEDARQRRPTPAIALALADACAALHACWWGRAGEATWAPPPHDEAHLLRFVDIARPGVPHVKEQLAAYLQPHWPALIDAVFANLPRLLTARGRDHSSLTLIHADPNPGNIMLPRNGATPLYLIDCQPFDWSLTTWVGPYDLAYIMALYWEPDERAALAMPLLHRYHAQLLARGVTGYSRQQCVDDYRLCALLGVTVAVEYLRGGGDPRWHDFSGGMLRRVLAAVEELDCAALWRD